jgi:hypothetical protein
MGFLQGLRAAADGTQIAVPGLPAGKDTENEWHENFLANNILTFNSGNRRLVDEIKRDKIPALAFKYTLTMPPLVSTLRHVTTGASQLGTETDFSSEPSEPDAGHTAEGSSLGGISVHGHAAPPTENPFN